MADVERTLLYKGPLSGDVTQTINPWTWVFGFQGAQIGLFNINLGTSPRPEVEHRILDEVGSYGRQLGRIGEAVEVLIDQLDRAALKPDERDAIDAFRGQMASIRAIKRGETDREESEIRRKAS